jgi:segregation and condensation protein B
MPASSPRWRNWPIARSPETHQRTEELYDADGTAFQIEEIAGGYQLLTQPVYHPWLNRLRRTSNELRLSRRALETLAIIAYRQPIMRAEVENIRGVQCRGITRSHHGERAHQDRGPA